MQRAEGLDEGADLVRGPVGVLGRALGGDEHGGVGDARGAHGGQHGTRSAFEVAADAVGLEGPYRVEEAHGVAYLPYPVPGGAHAFARLEVRAHPGAGDRGDDRDPRGREGDLLGHLAVGVEHGVHVRGVEGVGDRQTAGAAAEFGEPAGDGGHGGLVTADDGLLGPVDAGDRDALGGARPHFEGVEGLDDLGLGGLHGGHGSAALAGLHQAAAGGDQAGRVVQREDPGDVGGGKFADGVPGDRGGAHTPRLPLAEQRRLDGEQGGLGVLRLVDEFGAAEDERGQRLVQVRVERGADRVEGLPEDREGGVQGAAHTGALAALSGEQHREGAVGRGAFGGARGVRPSARARSAVTASAVVVTVRAARCSKCVRWRAAVYARSATGTSGRPSSQSAQRAACVRRAASSRPERTRGRGALVA